MEVSKPHTHTLCVNIHHRFFLSFSTISPYTLRSQFAPWCCSPFLPPINVHYLAPFPLSSRSVFIYLFKVYLVAACASSVLCHVQTASTPARVGWCLLKWHWTQNCFCLVGINVVICSLTWSSTQQYVPFRENGCTIRCVWLFTGLTIRYHYHSAVQIRLDSTMHLDAAYYVLNFQMST